MSKSDDALAALTAADKARFWKKVDQSGSCWLWTGCRLPSGYGKFGMQGVVVTAHRFALTMKLGHPPRHQAIHSCDTPSCVNPAHLRDGTQVDNMMDAQERDRIAGPTAENARKTHCVRGHSLSGANLISRPRGRRGCRECQRQAEREYARRKRAAIYADPEAYAAYRARNAAYARQRRATSVQ